MVLLFFGEVNGALRHKDDKKKQKKFYSSEGITKFLKHTPSSQK